MAIYLENQVHDESPYTGTTASAAVNVTLQNEARRIALGLPKGALIDTPLNDRQYDIYVETYAKLLEATTKEVSTASGPVTKYIGVSQPTANYKWNLPPHKWSLPVRPTTMDPEFVGANEYDSFHGLRRGRIWFWAGVRDTAELTAEGLRKLKGGTVEGSSDTAASPATQVDNDYAFQFLWNPTTISTSVVRNMEITPNQADTLKVVAGAFPGQETVSLNIMLDRVNDFACIKASSGANSVVKNINPDDPASFTPVQELLSNNYTGFSSYYTGNSYPVQSNEKTIEEKISDLMKQGTMADLEYLFKAINGGYAWKNLLGKKTANIGFLMPTLMGIQLGPTLDSLNYVGWVTNIGINHTDFTENMIPIRTTVSLSIECFSGSGNEAS
jgi:hypothetical protein